MTERLKKGFVKVSDMEKKIYETCRNTVQKAGLNPFDEIDDSVFQNLELTENTIDAMAILQSMYANEQLRIRPFIDANGMQTVVSAVSGKTYQLQIADPLPESKESLEVQYEQDAKVVLPLPSTPAMGDIPMILENPPMPPAQVYVPQNRDTSKYEVEAEVSSSGIVDEIAARYVIRSYRGELYVYNILPDKFRKLDGIEPEQFIDKFLRDKGQRAEPAEIKKIKDSLRFHSGLAIREPLALPDDIVAFFDGIVNIRTGERIPNGGRYFITQTLSCYYMPAANCPVFETFVASAMGGDPLLVELIWEIIGYIISNDTKAKKFFVFVGEKDTGKSLTANIIESLFEEDAVHGMSINQIGEKFAISELVDKRLGLCMDLGDEPLNENAVGMIKAITGGDKIRAEAKYKAGITTRIPAKLLFGTNHRLRIKRPDFAFSDRQVVVPFRFPVPKEKQDRSLFKRICQDELPGIAIRAAAAYLRLVDNHYEFPDALAFLPTEDEVSNDKIIADFTVRCCELVPGAKTSTENLYRAYEQFTLELGLPSLEKNKFSEIFGRLNPGLTKKKINFDGQPLQGYIGIKLRFQ